MTGLLELKERLIRFFGKNEIYVVPVLKFILATVVFLLINQNIGYMTRLAGLPVTLVLALLCAVLPVNAILLFAFILIAAHLFALSMDVCVVGLILMLVIALLYLRFSPKDGYYAVLTPIIFLLSHVVTNNEIFFVQFGSLCMTVWIIVLIFISIREINNYTVKETFKIIFLTIFTILIVCLLIFIIYVLWSQVFDFIQSIAGEVVYRIGS